MSGSDVALLTRLDQVVTDLGFGKINTTVAGSTLNMFVHTMSLMSRYRRSAARDHAILHRAEGRRCAFLRRLGAGLHHALYTTAPAVAAMAKYNLHATVNTAAARGDLYAGSQHHTTSVRTG